MTYRLSLVEAGELILSGLRRRHGDDVMGRVTVLRFVLDDAGVPFVFVDFEPNLSPASTTEVN